ncbi:MAG TPA: ribosome maturation factor RimP [Acidimicrobiia bacterium]|nr:ribosome maturation factor RimP [Acidimicrobiia bacterium]
MTDRLWDRLEPFLAAEGVELDDLDVRGQGPGRIVRVTVDAEGGVGVDRIAEISRGLSRALDDEDSLSGPFTLEVSSPGLERDLRRPTHYRKAVGREVDVRTTEPIAEAQRHVGVLEDADEDAITVVVDGSTRRIPLAAVKRAKTVYRWEQAPKPGRK